MVYEQDVKKNAAHSAGQQTQLKKESVVESKDIGVKIAGLNLNQRKKQLKKFATKSYGMSMFSVNKHCVNCQREVG